MTLAQALVAAVPTGKAFFWVVVTVVTVFWAGVGAALNFSELSAMPEQVGLMQLDISRNSLGLTELRSRADDADAARGQILCLVRLTAEGGSWSPLQVQERCP